MLNYKDEYLTNPQYDGVQLRLDKSSGRIHGFFIENVYYIRFLDRRHNMYISEGYGGVDQVVCENCMECKKGIYNKFKM